MRRLLGRRQRHGWSWAELSRRCGLPVWNLLWWHRRLSTKSPARRSMRAFVPVQVVDPPRGHGSGLEVLTPSGVRVLVPVDFSAEHLRPVLNALEPAC